VAQLAPFYTGTNAEPFSTKTSFIKAKAKIKAIINSFKPDMIHAHYASSYGLLGALSGFYPLIISAWGSDVFSFPAKSPLHNYILRYNFKRADVILSTSHALALETKKYTAKSIGVTPFGIDTNTFRPMEVKNIFSEGTIVIGTVKQLEVEYGISDLLRAFALVKKRNEGVSLKLLIVGSGSLLNELKILAKELKIENDTVFTGFIPPAEVPAYHNMIDISVFPSLQESFGVSVLEASACEKPVIVSNVGGLPEVVEDGVTGIIVPPADPDKLADAIEKLVRDEELRKTMGKKGREGVERLYNWQNNVKQMIAVYEQAVNKG